MSTFQPKKYKILKETGNYGQHTGGKQLKEKQFLRNIDYKIN